jgi:hypothetical protein
MMKVTMPVLFPSHAFYALPGQQMRIVMAALSVGKLAF